MMENRGRTSASRRSLSWVAAVLLAALVALPATEAGAQGANIHQRAGGLVSPIGLANAGDGTNRVFIVEQAGCIRFFLLGSVVGTPCAQVGTRFLDIRNRVASGGERGLLGLAFHPQYATNGFFFVYYTSLANATPPVRNTGDIVISRFTVTADPNVADPASERILMVIPHSQFSNHNGGQIAFGPDGFLYMAVGDGGSGGDPSDNAQNLNSLLGKIHRIDVDEPAAPFYRIPPTNPFQSGGPGTCFNGCDEIWAYGLRNPWRFSFDRLTGDLYIGDVGQGAWEEIDFQPAGAPGGRNYGWDVLEGGLHGSGPVPSGNCHENVPVGACQAMITSSALPILEYDRATGTTVIGGYVYRGRVLNDLWSGSYVFSDFGSGRLWRGFRDGGGNWQMEQMFSGLGFITSFGEDDRGNLYFVRNSALWQIFPHSVVAVPPDSSSIDFIERMYASGLTAGCGDEGYCGSAVATREQVAPLLLRAADFASDPPACGEARFTDVAASSPFCPWIEELARRGVVAGCGGKAYCPEAPLTRAEMAVFLVGTFGLH
jgi:glucose/arabinose dehydrogenase